MTARGMLPGDATMEAFDRPNQAPSIAETDEVSPSTSEPPPPWRAGRSANVAAAAPVAIAALMVSLVPGYADQMLSKPPDMLGIPFGLVLYVVAVLWSLLGAAVIGQTRFRVLAAIAVATTTIPALAVLSAIPSLISAIQRL